VDLSVKGNVAYITLNRPEAMNALNEAVVGQLEEAFNRAETLPEVQAVVFQGAGKAFVAGADIRYFVEKIKSDRISDIISFTRKGHELLLRIENSPKLTIALLDGLSLGGGSELALACQAIIATSAGSFGFPETGIGIYPGLGGMLRTAGQVGKALAKYYTFTGAPISAQDARDLGIVTRLVQPADVDSEIDALIAAGKPDKYREREIPDRFKPMARLFSDDNIETLLAGKVPADSDPALAEKTVKQIGYKAPLALKVANEIIDAQAGKPISEAVEIELGRLSEMFSTQDALEGLSSLGRKRPVYTGK
jgi:enoyl-CoA hydratase/3-hydroxyacyl-CoA dehydrogenase